MNLIAFDTSTEYLSVAVASAGRVWQRDELAEQKHSAWLLPWIQELLDDAKLNLQQIDAIAFGNGPGSFTGLRIGAGVAQGLALGSGKPLIPINSLVTLASTTGGNRVISCLDARMNQVYLAAYEGAGTDWKVVAEPGLFNLDGLPELPDLRGCVAIGSGFDRFPQVEAFYAAQIRTLQAGCRPSAEVMLRIARHRYGEKAWASAADADLLYLRNKVAQTSAERSGRMG